MILSSYAYANDRLYDVQIHIVLTRKQSKYILIGMMVIVTF